jgi:hypothetical protein
MSLVMSLDTCVQVNEKLNKAAKAQSATELVDIISTLQASDVRGKLKVRTCQSQSACALPERSAAL